MALHTIIAVRQKEPAWVEAGAADFIKRLGDKLQETTIRPPSRALAKPIDVLKAQEGKAIVKALDSVDSHVVALDVQGKTMSTERLAENITQWTESSGRITWVIGGADGLDDCVCQRADTRLSLSPMTFPHHLARIILLEQIYRATTINTGHPYHRA